jgi:poly(3-hydroxybutyrate) depolymerase
MHTKSLPALLVGLSLGVGCGSTTPEDPGGAGGAGGGTAGSAAGSSTSGSPAGGNGSGGSAVGGAGSGGMSGGAGSGGTVAGAGGLAGGGTGGTAVGGTGGAGGNSAGGSSGSGGGGGMGGKNAPVPSKGCGNPNGRMTLTTGGMSIGNGLATSTQLKITSGGMSRDYIIDIPADYDPSRPYRVVFSWHQAYGSANGNAIGQHPAGDGPNFTAANYAYFGLHREATAAKDPTIFVAPAGIGNFPWDFNRDSVLFDDLLALVGTNLCIDESRVFTTGFSFGAMMSYALSITRQTKLRGAVTMAAANYNLPGQPTDSKSGQVAYMGITGMSDTTCAWVNSDADKKGGKYCVLTHAADNGCTVPGNIQTAMVGSKKYSCYDFEGCKAGYPVKVCTFDGAHTPSSVNDGSTNGDDGLKAFVPPLAWKFISQF